MATTANNQSAVEYQSDTRGNTSLLIGFSIGFGIFTFVLLGATVVVLVRAKRHEKRVLEERAKGTGARRDGGHAKAEGGDSV